MSNKTNKNKEPAIDFIETPIEKPKTIKKQKKENIDVDKEQLNKTISAHKLEIAKSKQDIKRNKLLIKQAKLLYKLEKMERSTK